MKKRILVGIWLALLITISGVAYADQCTTTNNLRVKHIETYKINSDEYHIALSEVSDGKARFKAWINIPAGYTWSVPGESTGLLEEGESYTLSDGTKITLDDVYKIEAETGFYLSAAKFCFNGKAGTKVIDEEDKHKSSRRTNADWAEKQQAEEMVIPKKDLINLNLNCAGCMVDDSCMPIGTRFFSEGKSSYCKSKGETAIQKIGNDVCMNNYECKSNLCINGQCVTSGLWKKIMNWFSKIFGMAVKE